MVIPDDYTCAGCGGCGGGGGGGDEAARIRTARESAACTDRRAVLIFARPHWPSRTRVGLVRSLQSRISRERTLAPLLVPVLAKRKPLLLFRLDGVLLLRLAERALFALLFHEPPRNTRFDTRSTATSLVLSRTNCGFNRATRPLRRYRTERVHPSDLRTPVCLCNYQPADGSRTTEKDRRGFAVTQTSHFQKNLADPMRFNQPPSREIPRTPGNAFSRSVRQSFCRHRSRTSAHSNNLTRISAEAGHTLPLSLSTSNGTVILEPALYRRGPCARNAGGLGAPFYLAVLNSLLPPAPIQYTLVASSTRPFD